MIREKEKRKRRLFGCCSPCSAERTIHDVRKLLLLRTSWNDHGLVGTQHFLLQDLLVRR